MIRTFITIAACLVAGMVAVKDGRVLRAAGLTGACTVVQQAANGAEMDACRPGKLEGRPDLSHRGCRIAATTTTYQYWTCPGLQANP